MVEPFILGIESSCDETAAAVVHGHKVLSNVIASQELVHKYYGGVVPELASRAHQQKIIPVVEEAIKQAGIVKKELNAIAFTRGPGLMGALLVGVSFTKGMSWALDIPMIEVNHMKAHILAHLIDDGSKPLKFPFICLTVSGGHTQLVIVKSANIFELAGETLDDAAGEAFDKAAKALGLPYPGGPLIDQFAKVGNKQAFKFNLPLVTGYNYSFSGLKTSLVYFLDKHQKENPLFIEQHLNDICASYQNAIVNVLMRKLNQLIKDTGINQVAIAGGVSANSELRSAILDLEKKGCDVKIPQFSFCTDNAAMIAIAGLVKYKIGEFAPLSIGATARYSF